MAGPDVVRSGDEIGARAGRPVVLVMTRYYLPGFKGGGPIRSIANLVEALGDEFDFRIVTSDRDAGDVKRYATVVPGKWHRVGKGWVSYLPAGGQRILHLWRLMQGVDCDVLYLNSFWDPVFTTVPLIFHRSQAWRARCGIILAPRGEFSRGALGLKQLRKSLFLRVARWFGLHENLVWHATGPLEAEDIQRVIGVRARRVQVVQISTAEDLAVPISTSLPASAARPRDSLSVCFLSRISPKKNLDYALRILRSVDVSVHFDVYGPSEDVRYADMCRQLAASMPSNVSVTFRGPVAHEQVRETLQGYDLLFVPTLGENYGHVFIEAFSAGVPVLTSDQTPWLDLEAKGVGWALPLDEPGPFVDALRAAAGWRSPERAQLRRKCLEFAAQHLGDGSAVAANRRLIMSALPLD